MSIHAILERRKQMKTTRMVLLSLTVGAMILSASLLMAQQPTAGRFWGQWRGPSGSGASSTANPPVEWSETTNIRWKIEIPGRGTASPVVWGDRVYLLTAVPVGISGTAAHQPRGGVEPRGAHRFVVMAINRRDGKVAWERIAREAVPHSATHSDNGTWASASAVTDGQHVIANFESQGLYAYDMDGTLIWQKDLGDKTIRNEFGEGASPALHGNHLVLVWDERGQSFVVALDKRTGQELWRVNRDEIDSWATPLIVQHAGRAQVVTNGMNRLRSYDLETGRIVWESEGTTMNAIPSPVAADGTVIVTGGFRGSDLKAVRLADARGDITGTNAIAWSLSRDTPYVPSPLLYDGILYLLKSNSGILSTFDHKTGKPHYTLQRLEGVPNVFSSPVGGGGRVYFPGREGTTLVLRHGPTYQVLATNRLDDGFDASPAVVDDELYLRGYRYLYCIAAS
jgi:outer membrane protein assembly factor BamB